MLFQIVKYALKNKMCWGILETISASMSTGLRKYLQKMRKQGYDTCSISAWMWLNRSCWLAQLVFSGTIYLGACLGIVVLSLAENYVFV